MAVTMMREDVTNFTRFAEPSRPCAINELCRPDEDEVVEFLSARPVHTVFMMGLIRDNGLISPMNRGSFYGSRGSGGQLEAVGLIGHAIMIEAHTENSLVGFARIARNCQNSHLIRGEQESINTFWTYFADAGHDPRLISSEQLFQLDEAPAAVAEVEGLRTAGINDVEKVMAVNASMAFEEGGVNPFQRDPKGFRNRTLRRIEQNRVWVWVEDNRLIFKADIVSQTPDVTYLEGVYVHPEERRKGYGLQCLSKLSKLLLENSKSICLTVNERNQKAVAFYMKAGFKFHSHYETIYLR